MTYEASDLLNDTQRALEGVGYTFLDQDDEQHGESVRWVLRGETSARLSSGAEVVADALMHYMSHQGAMSATQAVSVDSECGEAS